MILLFFGSENCSKCGKAYKFLNDYVVDKDVLFVYIDSLHDWNQDFCDYFDVEELPHILMIDNTSSFVTKHFVGFKKVLQVKKYLDELV